VKRLIGFAIAAATLAVAPSMALGSSGQTTPGPGYLTIQFGRSIEGSYTGTSTACARVSGIQTLQQDAADLQSRGMIGTSPVILNRAGASTEDCINGDVYADWTDLQSLNATYGWQVDSAGTDYTYMTNSTLTAADQTAESCGSLPTFTAEGFNDASGLFAYPDNKSTATIQQNIVAPCYAYGRLYATASSYATSINNRNAMNANGYQLTTNVLGGECNDPTQSCYSISTVVNNSHYESPVALAALVASEGNDQWLDLQFYRLMTGVSTDGAKDSWNCDPTQPWTEHWTSVVEGYCAVDFDQILDSVPAGIVSADPATVAAAWGRVAMPPPPPVDRLSTSTYLGGHGSDMGNMVAAAPDGGTYATGYLNNGNLVGFVVEYSPSGAIEWDTNIASAGSVTPYYIRADGTGVYVVGVTTASGLPDATNTDPVSGGTAFISVLSPTTGAVDSSTYLGGKGYSAANVDAIDPTTGDVYVGSSTGSQTDVQRLDPTGTSVLWSTLLGGAGFSTHPYGMQSDSLGDVVVTTLTASPIYPLVNAAQGTYGGGQDTGITDYSATGTILWSTYYGGSGEDRPNGVDIDPNGNIYVAGRTWSTNLPLLNALYTINAATTAGYVAEYSGAGGLLYSTYIGGQGGNTFLGGIAVTANGTAWVVGGSDNGALPVVGGGAGYVKGNDAYVAAIEPDDAGLSFATYLGGSASDGASSPALSSAGLWVIGRTDSANFPIVGATQPSNAGSYDAFVSLFTSA
jgi:hypothetical protein